MSTNQFSPGKYLLGICRSRQKITPEDIANAEKDLWVGLDPDKEIQIGVLTKEDIEFKQLYALRKKTADLKNRMEQIAIKHSDSTQAMCCRKTAQAYEAEVYCLDCIISGLLKLAFDPNETNPTMYYFKTGWIVVASIE